MADRRAGERERGVGRPPSRAERRAARAEVDDPAIVLDAAARLLEARPRAVAELRTRLLGTGYRADLVEATVQRLLAAGYLDDAAFARGWVGSRDRAHPRGAAILRRELLAKGVPRDVVDAVLADRRPTGGLTLGDGQGAVVADASPAEPTGADEAAAERLLDRRGAALRRVADPRLRRQRAYALLARNGFDPDVCRAVAVRWLAALDDDTATGDAEMTSS